MRVQAETVEQAAAWSIDPILAANEGGYGTSGYAVHGSAFRIERRPDGHYWPSSGPTETFYLMGTVLMMARRIDGLEKQVTRLTGATTTDV